MADDMNIIEQAEANAQAMRTEIEGLRAENANLRLRLDDYHRGIDHRPAACTLLVCPRCDTTQEARRG